MFSWIKCAAGYHAWRRWIYVSSDSCVEEKVCGDCAERQIRTNHQSFSIQYNDSNSCQQINKCTRCGYYENIEVVHVFGEEEYENEMSCQKITRCKRCGTSMPANIAHSFSENSFENVDDERYHKRLQRCSRCGYNLEFSEDHSFSDWILHDSNSTRRDCLICGYRQIVLQPTRGVPSAEKKRSDSKGKGAVRCIRCGEVLPVKRKTFCNVECQRVWLLAFGTDNIPKEGQNYDYSNYDPEDYKYEGFESEDELLSILGQEEALEPEKDSVEIDRKGSLY